MPRTLPGLALSSGTGNVAHTRADGVVVVPLVVLRNEAPPGGAWGNGQDLFGHGGQDLVKRVKDLRIGSRMTCALRC